MTRHPVRRRGLAATATAGLLLAGALAACSAKTSNTSAAENDSVRTVPGAPAPAGGGADQAAPPGAANFGSGGNDNSKGSPTTPQGQLLPANAVQRSIIYNGSITVAATDVNGAADRAETLATGAGGYVGGDARQNDGGHTVATIVLRVPADHFDATMNAIATLGTPQARQVTTQDVTAQVIDVSSRIKTQQASVDRVRALLAKATTIGDIESIESELTQRQADLESMEAQLASLNDLATLSTITLTLVEPNAPPPAPAKKPAGKGFVSGLKSGWHHFTSAVSTVLNWIGVALPFVLGIGIPVWLIAWLMRRRSRPRFAVAPAGPPVAKGTDTGTEA